MGPRIYNLLPTLAGPISAWGAHLERIAAMHFDWVFINPFHAPGGSQSLYAVADYYRLNPLLRGAGAGAPPGVKAPVAAPPAPTRISSRRSRPPRTSAASRS